MALCAVWAGGVCVGCGYGDIGPEAYSYARAIDAVASRRAADRIDAIESQIDAGTRSGSLAAREAGWLRELLDECRAERWTEARRGARGLLESQARSAP